MKLREREKMSTHENNPLPRRTRGYLEILTSSSKKGFYNES